MSIQHFPPLKPDQFDRIRDEVRDRIFRFIGETPPQRDDYLQQVPSLPPTPSRAISLKEHIQPTDWLIPMLFVALLVISMSHIMTFAGQLANEIYHEPPVGFQGLWLSRSDFTMLHQIGFFAFSELGILFFYTRHTLHRLLWRGKLVSVSLIVAILCTLVSVYANVTAMQSATDALFGSFIGLLVPLTTLFLGERLAEIVRSIIVERAQQQKRYTQALQARDEALQAAMRRYENDFHLWHTVRNNVTLFDMQDGINSYMNYLREAILSYYRRTAHGRNFDWTFEAERALFDREWRRVNNLALPSPTVDEPPAQPTLVDDTRARLEEILRTRPELRGLSGNAIATKLVAEGLFDKLSAQYVNRVKRQLIANNALALDIP